MDSLDCGDGWLVGWLVTLIGVDDQKKRDGQDQLMDGHTKDLP